MSRSRLMAWWTAAALVVLAWCGAVTVLPAADGAGGSGPGASAASPLSGGAGAGGTAGPGGAAQSQPSGSPLNSSPLASLPAGARIAVIPIDEPIDQTMYQSIKTRIDRAVRQGATVLVFEFNCDVGDPGFALLIAEEIRRSPVSSVAWLNRQAMGPAAIVAASCHEIVSGSGPAMGMIDIGGGLRGGSAVAVADRVGPTMQSLRDGAARSNIPFVVFEAMATPGVEVYLIRNKTTGEQKLVNQADYQVLVEGKDPDVIFAAEMQRLAGKFGLLAPRDPQEKLKTADGTEVDAQALGGVFSNDPLALRQMGQWALERQLHNGKVAWSMTDPDLTRLGVSAGQVYSDSDLTSRYRASGVIRIQQTWPESLAYWLISGPVRAALILIMVTSLLVEMKMPGIGYAGALALICMVLLIGAPFLVGLASVWHVLVFVLGIVLLALEIFVFPGFGVCGIGGIFLLLLGLVLIILPTGPGGTYNSLPAVMITRMIISSSAWTLAGIIGGMGGLYFALKFLPDIPGANRLVLKTVQPATGSVDPQAQDQPVGLPGGETGVSGDGVLGGGRVAVGSVGYVTAPLRPVGLARIGEDTVDVITTSGWIEVGAWVRVTQIEGSRIYVEPMDQATA